MTSFLQPCVPLPATARAAFLASSRPEHWFLEVKMIREQSPQSAPQLFLVPQSGNNLQAQGVLVLTKVDVEFSHRSLPLHEPFLGIFLLNNTKLTTTPTVQEAAAYFPHDITLILPHLGNVGFSEEDALSPSQLLNFSIGSRDWNASRAAPESAPQFQGIQLIVQDDLEELLSADESNDIGTKAGEKPSKKNPLSSLGGGLTTILGGAAGLGVLGLSPFFKIPKMWGTRPPEAGPDVLDRLQDWAKKNWKNVSDARQKELNRLLDMLDKDTLEGLRHAIPLSGFEGRRGQAAPGWKLGRRDLSLGGQQGGYAVDGWDIDYQTRLALERKYRDAALRETEAGRHERAAFIYGNLLGDWAKAARSFTEAGKHREATSIYLNKLNNPSLAAEALEQSGLLDQAVELYLKCENFEKAGDLLKKIKQDEQANLAYERAVAKSTDPKDSARLLFEKLERPDAALKVLTEAWQASRSPLICLRYQFSILHQCEREEEARILLEEIESSTCPLDVVQKAKLALEQKKKWSETQLPHDVDELILRLSATSLADNPQSNQSKELLGLLPRSNPHDPLLERDVNRFRNQRFRPKTIHLGTKAGVLRPKKIIPISLANANWTSLTDIGRNHASLAGYQDGLLAVGQIQNGQCLATQYRTPNYPGRNSLVTHLGFSDHSFKSRLFHFPKTGKVHYQAIGTAPSSFQNLDEYSRVLAIGEDQKKGFLLLTYSDLSSLLVEHYSLEGKRTQSLALDLAPPEITEFQWHLAAHEAHYVLAGANFVTWRLPDESYQSTELQEPAISLQLAPAHLSPAALITTKSEVILSNPTKKSNRPPDTINLHHSYEATPLTCYTNDGHLIIFDGKRGLAFELGKFGSHCATIEIPKGSPAPTHLCSYGPSGFLVLAGESLIQYE